MWRHGDSPAPVSPPPASPCLPESAAPSACSALFYEEEEEEEEGREKRNRKKARVPVVKVLETKFWWKGKYRFRENPGFPMQSVFSFSCFLFLSCVNRMKLL